jgi:hypothetical protein
MQDTDAYKVTTYYTLWNNDIIYMKIFFSPLTSYSHIMYLYLFLIQ